MNRPRLALLSLVITAALAVACGGDDDDSSGNAGAAGSAGASADGLSRLVQAMCERESSCCGANETPEACRDSFTSALRPLFTLPGLEANATRVDACVASYQAASCEQAANHGGIIPLTAFCADLFKGALPDGSACGSTDFIAGLFDDDQCSSGYCADKVCAQPVPEGQPCKSPSGCQAGLTCYQGSCLHAGTEGEDCSQKGLCTPDLECMTLTSGKCETPGTAKVGETCEQGKRCELGPDACFCAADDLGCVTGVCGKPSYCKK